MTLPKDSFIHRFYSLLIVVIITLSPLISSGQSTESQGAQKIYVCNQGSASVSVIDVNTLEITDTIDLQKLGFSANAKPHHVISEKDGSFWYLTLIGANRVLKFDQNNKLVAQTETEVPGLMSINADGDELYVGRSMSAVNPPQSFVIIRRSDMKIVQEVDLFFSRPHALVHIPKSTQTLVGSLSANQILSIDTQADSKNIKSLDGPTHVFVNFAVSPDGSTMVATAQVTGKLLVFDLSDPANPKLVKELQVRSQPWHPIYSPDGQHVYFANKGANVVTSVNMETMEVEYVIENEALAQPHGAALSKDGRLLFVSANNLDGEYATHVTADDKPAGTLTIINTSDQSIVKVLEVGANPTGVGTQVAY